MGSIEARCQRQISVMFAARAYRLANHGESMALKARGVDVAVVLEVLRPAPSLEVVSYTLLGAGGLKLVTVHQFGPVVQMRESVPHVPELRDELLAVECQHFRAW
jgi:hypothetical protein